MDDRLRDAIVALLKELGYANVDTDGENIWYEDSDGDTYSINAVACAD